MKGIDVSKWQGTIDFKKVKASGVEIVIIKATEGDSYVSSTLMAQYNGAIENGLKVGFYHFLTKQNPVVQAQHFLATVSKLKSDCKYVIDVEGEWTIKDASNFTRGFANYVISKGYEMCLYTGDYFYRDNLDATVKDLPLWIANYGKTVMAKNYVGLQYSEKGSVDGISGNVDMDDFTNGIFITPKPVPVVEKKAPTIRTGKVTASILNVRQTPDEDGLVIGKLALGAVVKIDKKYGEWYSIFYGNNGGYVNANYIK